MNEVPLYTARTPKGGDLRDPMACDVGMFLKDCLGLFFIFIGVAGPYLNVAQMQERKRLLATRGTHGVRRT